MQLETRLTVNSMFELIHLTLHYGSQFASGKEHAG
jgi:hypothetical protein